MEGSQLLVNLVLALGAASIGALVAARLGQSVILGYILAGVVIAPTTPGLVGDLTSVEALADIGVILLMFTIGLRLSLSELRTVGSVAILGGGVQVLIMIGLGYLIGRAVGWGWQEALFFGAVVSNSSSTVLSKVLADRGQAGALHTRVALGWSTVQDLSTIILVVVLSSLVVGRDGSGLVSVIAISTGKAALFLFLLLGVGGRILPAFFDRVAALQNREVFITAVAGVALGMAFISSLFGLSLAIGAFVVGVVAGESDISHEILGSVQPMRDVFVGLFFVSVGMLVDVGFLVREWPLLLLVAAVIMLLKGAISSGIAWLFHYPPRTAILTGVALGQSAEFSFLMARVGVDLGAISPAVFTFLLGGSAVSIASAPWFNALADPAARALERRLLLASLDDDAVVDEKASGLRGHAVICGYGRVGRMVAAALRRRGFQFVVIDQERGLVESLREHGIPALLGSVDNQILLERAGVSHARVVVVAVQDALAARRIVDYVGTLDPKPDIVVRVQSEEERNFMLSRGVFAAILAEHEVAIELTRYALRRFGVSQLETLALVQRMRGLGTIDDPTGPDILPHSSDPA